jgi:hypothetical protein
LVLFRISVMCRVTSGVVHQGCVPRGALHIGQRAEIA